MGVASLLTYCADLFRIRALRLKRGVFQGLTAFRWEAGPGTAEDMQRLLQADDVTKLHELGRLFRETMPDCTSARTDERRFVNLSRQATRAFSSFVPVRRTTS